MIHESSYWKNDLIKLANKLELRLVQVRWGEKSLYTLEKEIFIGFYSIRKLIESKKISDSLKEKVFEVKQFSYKGSPNSIFMHFEESDYDLSKANSAKFTIAQLCNQFIHSHHFLPFFVNGKNLIGFFFCSDYKRTSGIYLITLFDIVEIYRNIGSNYPATMNIQRLPNGKSVTIIE
ncbi:hypothetical protein GCM10009098_03440 [Rheinheimera aquimaris]|uniref:Uncharacterized protein n=1 Tax=Rheinheimera aquimaris TaxID=412437 RepID=A0ABN1DBE6_9GAMM|nr:hypothetical protein [Rheinheimera aquimaris]MCB5212478.1 hypothetical protein [Rheinheimera aquimaris]